MVWLIDLKALLAELITPRTVINSDRHLKGFEVSVFVIPEVTSAPALAHPEVIDDTDGQSEGSCPSLSTCPYPPAKMEDTFVTAQRPRTVGVCADCASTCPCLPAAERCAGAPRWPRPTAAADMHIHTCQAKTHTHKNTSSNIVAVVRRRHG
jgi:hypothetical protein